MYWVANRRRPTHPAIGLVDDGTLWVEREKAPRVLSGEASLVWILQGVTSPPAPEAPCSYKNHT